MATKAKKPAKNPETERIKLNPPLGRLPSLQYTLPGELQIDAAYQRSIEGGESQSLIRKLAQNWNWDLCQPLVVSRRADGSLFVIDGQHRLMAARLRGDIAQLPSVIVAYADPKDEAASFVSLNQQRRPLTKLDLFKAAVASGDERSCAIAAAIEEAGLTIAPHMTIPFWKPGMIGNLGGIEEAWNKHGETAAREALQVLSTAFAGKVLAYAGTLFPGIAAVCREETVSGGFEPGQFARFTALLGRLGQDKLRREIMRLRADDPNLSFKAASVAVIARAWWPERAAPKPMQPKSAVPVAAPAASSAVLRVSAFGPGGSERAWCNQCDGLVTKDEATGCKSRFCSLRVLA